MEAARGRARELSDDDPVAAALVDYVDEHIEEERDHDAWLLDDLETIGVDRAATLARPPSPTVASAVGAQYYSVLHYHPVTLLAWIGLLECSPLPPALIGELRSRTGYGAEAFRALAAHAELDIGHGDELFAFLDGLPLSAELSTAIGLNAMSSVHLLAKALDEIARREPSPTPA